MAYRRSITARAKFIYQQQPRVAPSFSHTHRDDSDREELHTSPISRNPEIRNYMQQQRLFGTGNNFSNFHKSANVFQDRRFAIPAGCGLVLGRNYSSGIGEGAADNIELLNDVVGVVADKAVDVAPVLNEVAIAAADSFFPVAALQYLIDYVHCYTGLSWWASIAVTTLLIRWIQIPLLIYQLKATSKFAIITPMMQEIKDEMNDRGMSPVAVAEGQAKMQRLMTEHGVTPFTPLKGILISAPIFCSFFFAINNMVEKVPSFKEGGTLWFTDLTTPDAMYIFPVLTALTFWITVECNSQEGMEGNPNAGTIKTVSRVFAALSIPLTASFPKAIFCYWITSNFFSLAYGLVIKNPEVKKYLGVPIIPPPPPSTKPSLPFFEQLKKYAAAQKLQSLPSPTEASSSSTTTTTTSQRIPSSSVLNQRIKILEKEVRGRKRGKKGKKI